MKKFKLGLTVFNIKLFEIDIQTNVIKGANIAATMIFVLSLLAVGALYLPLIEKLL